MENNYQTTWNLSLLYKDENDPKIEEDIENVKKNTDIFIEKWKNRSDYLNNEIILKEALDDYESWLFNFGPCSRQIYYFWLRNSIDQNDTNIKARCNKINEISQNIQNNIRFFELNLAKIEDDYKKLFLKSNLLKDYNNFLNCIFNNAKYLLSEKEENILALKSKTSFENWSNLIEELLAKEEREVVVNNKVVTISFSEILSNITNDDITTRTSATKALNDIFLKISPIAEIEFNSILEDHRIDNNLKNMPRPDTYRHIADNIDPNVVDSLVKSVSDNFNISREFYELKAKLFGVTKLKYNERCLEYGSINKEYNFDESIKIIKSTFKNIDDEFYNIVLDLLNGHTDVFSRKGKSSGAFCTDGSKRDPVYVLLNHNNKLNDVLTIAHEFGHAINNYFMIRNQNALNFGNSLAIAEVASTFFEDFVLDNILNESDDELKLSIMMMKLNSDVSTIFRQVAFYKFETEVHNKSKEVGYLSKEEIGSIFQKHMKDYMGNSIEHSSGTENWWIYIGHFRRPFYVYSYASGLLISKAMQNNLKNNNNFIYNIKEFLSAGLYKSPKNIFFDMNIDITNDNFWNNGIKEIANLLEETKKLAKKLGKI